MSGVAAQAPSVQVVQVRNEQSSGGGGGTTSTGAWNKATLNTKSQDTGAIATLASSVLALPAGTYEVVAFQNFYQAGAVQIRLQNTSDGVTLLPGLPFTHNTASGYSQTAALQGRFTLTGTKNIELQYRCSNGIATNGLGVGSGFGTEVHADAFFRKVA